MSSTVAAILWTHLFTPGHDACRLIQMKEGFALEGHSNFEHEGKPCSLGYRVHGDSAWQTRGARVSGFLGNETVEIEISRTVNGDWLMNGTLQPGVQSQRDIDLGFTPATNLIALRRFALDIGAETDAPAAYILFPETKLSELKMTAMHQHYRRIDREHYDYIGTNYHEVLTVSDIGFVLEYPGLWKGQLWQSS
ncbi:MAG TPA: putative glycolipid-binding domain-containing protein [Rhizobiaceae bacterium]|nr:putative glycolipid-binding domain-containing protein [Rhizobiaceae bacterium]